MYRSLKQRLLYTLITFSLVFGSQSGRAEDTEIYFSGGDTNITNENVIRPNVLFILDTSGSMTNTLSGDSENRSRIEVLRDSMSEIIQEIDNVNLGLMRFTVNQGGPVLFPITYLETTVDNVLSESIDDGTSTEFTYSSVASEDAVEDIMSTSSDYGTVVTNNSSGLTFSKTATIPEITISGDIDTTITIQVEHDNDDAEEETDDSTNNMNDSGFGLDDSALEVDSDSMVGVRFLMANASGGTLSKCSEISDARLEFRTSKRDTGTQAIQVYGQDADSTARFVHEHQNISSRPDTTAVVIWNAADQSSGSWFDTDDGTFTGTTRLEDVIEEIVTRGDCANDAGTWDETSIVLVLERSGSSTRDRNWKSHDESNSQAPRLYITTTEEGDDTVIPEVPGTASLIAVRFEDVDIPQGADVSSATLSFLPNSDASGSNTWRIYGEDVDDSPAFSDADFHLSGRKTANLTTEYAEWTVPSWTEDDVITTSNTNSSKTLENVLQEIVDRSEWCGGNDITLFIEAQTDDNLRYADSLEIDSTAISLSYGYDSSASDGCYQATTTKQLEVSQDDAQQDGTNSLADVNENSIPIASQTSGFRFSEINLPSNASIISASIEFTSASATTGATVVSITGELPLDADADEFQYEINNITDRLDGDTGSVSWTMPATLAADEKFSTPSLTAIVQAMVDDGDWTSGQAMAFLFDPASDGNHAVYSRDGDATKAADLTITYQSDGAVVTKTARDRMVELVESLPATDHTPILDVLYEAAHYWRGESVVFGKSRQGSSNATLSHPASYCTAANDCGTGVVTSDTNEYGIDLESGCDYETEWGTSACNGSFINGSPNYITPFDTASTCQKNYQIFLSDGSLYDRSGGDQTAEIKSEYTTTCLANNSTFKSVDDSNLTYDSSGDDVELCAVDLAQFLNENDQIDDSVLDNDQTVQTSTVAFDLSGSGAQYMKDIANLGGGTFYEASSASDLVNIFSSFLSDVRNVPTSFVAPSLATNAFNRLLSRDEVYFGLFTPELDERWLGNIKKYNICISESDFGGCTAGEIIDAGGNSAIDSVTDRFDEDAVSLWTADGVVDNGETVLGGSGAEITTYHGTGGVTLYTEIGGSSAAGTQIASGTSLNTAGYVYTETDGTSTDWDVADMQAIRTDVCNPAPPSPVSDSHGDYDDCDDRMRWLLGKKIIGEPDSDINADQRWTTNDVLHSSPSVITYGGSDTDDPADGEIDVFFDKIVFGTNDGALHMINGVDGTEDWRFIPHELLIQQRDMFDNPQGDHKYGLDISPVLRVVDHNGNGIIELPDAGGSNDIVHIFMAMRRGGKNIYALDLSGEMSTATTSVTPKYLWTIQGGTTTGYSRLGYTWSQPTLATINTAAGQKEVLIFGGGYDEDLDSESAYGTTACSGDCLGNGIYIADAATGAMLFSVTGVDPDTGDSTPYGLIQVAEMQHSIPSKVTIQDSDRDGIDDRIYVGDTGGQVWRVDLGDDISGTGTILSAVACEALNEDADPDTNCQKTVVGRLAEVSEAGTDTAERRFFEPPSVVQVTDTQFASGIGEEYDYIMLGTGNRAHPLNEDVHDRFYAFRDTFINGMTAQDDSNEAEDYPQIDGTAGGDGLPIQDPDPETDTTVDLVNVTAQSLEDALTADADSVNNAYGWYFDFTQSNTVSGTVEEPGEKVLSAAVSIGGTVFFTTYLPKGESNADVCVGAQIGAGRAYNFNILSTKATIDWEGDDNAITGRKKALGGGIPSDVVPVFTEEGVIGIVGVEGGATQLGSLAGLPRFRTYWYEDAF